MQERRYDVDWLRIIAMLAVFLYHCTRFFDPEGWHLKNPEVSLALFVSMRGLIWTWVMELFFLLSGVGAWYALRSRRAGAYVWERIKRLLIPLYTVGLFVLLPLQFYFELVTNRGYSGNFWHLIPRYFSGFKPPGITQSPFTLLPIPFPGHLWFLQYLFLISLMSLPMLLYLKSEQGRRWVARLAGWCDSQGGIFVFVIPLSLVLIGLQGLFETQFSWANLLWYAIFFVIGYMMAADKRFMVSIRRHGWIYTLRRLVRYTLGHGHPDQAPDHRRGLLSLDHDPVRTVPQALQHRALFLRHATKEETVSNACPAPGRDFRLIVKRPERMGDDKIRRRPSRRCSRPPYRTGNQRQLGYRW
jgi:surface polysaccharide O-acyltransferase-like enzyme